jgi:Spy/CpxP family protein refolding chaperone
VAAIVTDNPATGNEAVVTAAPTTTNLGLMRNHNRRLDEADEEAFKSLSLPDATRARVRAINDELRKRTEGDVSPSNVQGAVQARRDQLRLLLGADGARQFDIEERGAVRRLRGKYRFEWGQQGRGK